MFGELPAYGLYMRHVNGITIKNIKFTLDDADFRPAFVFDDVKDLKMEEIRLPAEKQYQLVLKNVPSAILDDKIIKQKAEIKK
jgi:hypothetical protein